MMMEWQPISTAPKDGTRIDLWGINHLHYAKPGQRRVNVGWGTVRDWMGNERDDWQTWRSEDFEPTHWMPIPKPPTE
jgi:alpha-galactosidase/6-phospho-beta-glucosidase family protein